MALPRDKNQWAADLDPPASTLQKLSHFDETLHENLREYWLQKQEVSLLQYVDNLLLAVEDGESCMRGTEHQLHTLGEIGYQASAKKAQIHQ